MDDVGYLYVLANSAMPGLVKVGKTTRSPAERAVELSRATGLPTPFIVVYEQLFGDCSAAEAFVHTHLATKGYRVSDNREFFSGPVNDVVRAIALAPGPIDCNYIPSSANEPLIDLIDSLASDELDDLQLSTPQSSRQVPWKSVFEDAESHFHGLGDILQDYKQAMRLYVQATKLGSITSYSRIAGMYRDGNGVPASSDLALKYFKEGARKGNVYCYWAMGRMFWSPYDSTNRNAVNAEKCFSLFLNNFTDDLPDEHRLAEREFNTIIFDCVIILACKLENRCELPLVLKDFFVQRSESIKSRANASLDYHRTNNTEMQLFFQSVVDYLN